MAMPEEAGLNIQAQLIRDRGSAAAKYRALVVGPGGGGFLFKYELIMLLCSDMPGALGLALRKWLYPKILGRCGRSVVFGRGVTLRHPKKIRIGDNVVIDDLCLLDAKGETNAGIDIGSGVFIGRNTSIHCKNGDIAIGDDTNIGFNCEITSSGRVDIGPRVLMAAFSYVVGGGHEYSRTDIDIMDQTRTAKGIRVGAGAWIGAGTVVQDGVSIGTGAIVGAGAVVNRDLTENVIAAGVPARVLRIRSDSAAACENA